VWPPPAAQGPDYRPSGMFAMAQASKTECGLGVSEDLAGEVLHRGSLSRVCVPTPLQHGPDAMADGRIRLVFRSIASHDRENNGSIVLDVEEWQLSGDYLDPHER
jgi:hypothetical protein